MAMCPLTKNPYDEGSLEDVLHQYILADDTQFKEKFDALVQDRRILPMWYTSVLPELQIHTNDFFEKTSTPRIYETADYRAWIRRWNELGIWLGLNHVDLAEMAEALYKGLLSILRKAQFRHGWIPKGMAYHQIGWAKVITGRDNAIRRAEDYFITAMMEDILRDLKSGAQRGTFKKNPAYWMLSYLYQKLEGDLDQFYSVVSSAIAGPGDELNKLLTENVELILLEHKAKLWGQSVTDVSSL